MMSWAGVSFFSLLSLSVAQFLNNFDNISDTKFADGFFDAGMLLQALKARGEGLDNGETKPSERAAVHARRRDVGKKLRLIDY